MRRRYSGPDRTWMFLLVPVLVISLGVLLLPVAPISPGWYIDLTGTVTAEWSWQSESCAWYGHFGSCSNVVESNITVTYASNATLHRMIVNQTLLKSNPPYCQAMPPVTSLTCRPVYYLNSTIQAPFKTQTFLLQCDYFHVGDSVSVEITPGRVRNGFRFIGNLTQILRLPGGC